MCNHMYGTRDIYGHPVKVPCGSCVTCRRTQSTFWSHRIQSDIAELEKSGTGSSFVTLTLESDTTPILRKSDLQKFFKRLRKSCPDYPFKYLAIGYYELNTPRQHETCIQDKTEDWRNRCGEQRRCNETDRQVEVVR